MRVEHLSQEEQKREAKLLPEHYRELELVRLRDAVTQDFKCGQVIKVSDVGECIILAVSHARSFLLVAVVPV